MSKTSYLEFDDDDFARVGKQITDGGVGVLPGMVGTPAGDFAAALIRLGSVIGDEPIKMETIGRDLHVSRKAAA